MHQARVRRTLDSQNAAHFARGLCMALGPLRTIMIKVYKRVDAVLHYHEAWCQDGIITEHWGVVGEKGTSKEFKKPRLKSEDAAISSALEAALGNGYAEIEDDPIVVLIEYPVNGMGSPSDLDKRHALEERMNETLGWTGLGHCDGGSIGSGTMEVCCMVVDSEIAKRVIAEDLKGTEFADYSRIYEE